MSFLNLKVLKGKPTNFLRIMPHLKLSKHMFLEQKIEKQTKLQLIWTYENMSSFNHSKVSNYQMVMVFKF